jgi:hypothetical protein
MGAMKPTTKVLIGLGLAAVLSLAMTVIMMNFATPPAPKTAAASARTDSARTVLFALRDDPNLLIRRFGRPDEDEKERPRPTIVMRMLTYQRERVRVVYRANAPLGAPPPYEGTWKLVGFTDPTTDAALKPEIAIERLSSRDRGAK